MLDWYSDIIRLSGLNELGTGFLGLSTLMCVMGNAMLVE
jgi:hypothetical protein